MKTVMIRISSSSVSISGLGIHGRPSAGMQYEQRRLQRSVTETLRSVATRPKVSGIPAGGTDAIGRLFIRPSVGRYRRQVLRVVISRRWLTMLAIAVVFAVACMFIGRWQWHRHEAKAARAERIDSHYSARPIPLSRALPAPDAKLSLAQEWTQVTATGRYAAQQVILVRNRPNNGVFGYEVVVPLDLADGTSLLVDRGWIPNGRTAAEPSSTPATPAGDITVTGWLRLGEPSLGRQMSNGQLASINLAEARAQSGTSLYGAYLIRRAEAGPPGEHIETPQALELTDTDLGPPLAYALQWWLAAPVGFVLVMAGVRREHLERDDLPPVPGQPAAPARAPKVKKIRIWDEEDE